MGFSAGLQIGWCQTGNSFLNPKKFHPGIFYGRIFFSRTFLIKNLYKVIFILLLMKDEAYKISRNDKVKKPNLAVK